MIHVILVKNPFDVRQKEDFYMPYLEGKPVESYHCQDGGEYVYSLCGVPCEKDTIPEDGQEIVVMPVIAGGGRKGIFGAILSVGFAVLSGGIMGAAWGSMWTRLGVAMAVSMIGNVIVNKLTPVPKIDLSNTEQSNTYGWGAMQTQTGQGYVLPVLYGAMKTAGLMLQRHVESDGEKQYLSSLYALCEGPIDEISDIRLNDNPIDNYSGVTVETRYGNLDQDVIINFNDSYADEALSYVLDADSAWHTKLLAGNTANGIEITISFPMGMYYSKDDASLGNTWVDIESEYRKAGGTWKTLWKGRISASTNTAFYRVFKVEKLESAQYEVRIRCTRKDGTTVRYVNRAEWIGVTQIIYDDFAHPGKALVGLRALATDQLSGSDPQFTCLVKRNHVYAWNPQSQSYEEKAADNPAWAAYDILHHCRKVRNVDGQAAYFATGVDASNMDYFAFAAWADKCDEAGIHFNYLYDSAMKVWDAVAYPCRVGRGAILQRGTKYSCIYDYADEPSQLFTVANIKKDSLREEFQAVSERANAIEISFLNAEKNYERDVLTVYGETYDNDQTASTPTQLELMGCTSVKEAYRYGQWKLRENKYEIRTVSFDAFSDAIACTIGDVITVQSDVTAWGIGGRIVAVDGLTVQLDQPAEAEYTKILVRKEDSDQILTLMATCDGTDKVKVETVQGITPGAVYALGKVGKEAKNFKVLTIEKSLGDETRTITAIEYYPELYSPDIDKVPEILPYDNTIPGPKNLMVTVTVIAAVGGKGRYRIHCTWENPRIPNNIHIESNQDGSGVWLEQAVLSRGENEYAFDVDSENTYTIRVYATNEIGKKSAYATARVNMSGLITPAMTPENLIAYTRYRQLPDGTPRYDISLSWEPKELQGGVYYKTNHAQAGEITIKPGVSADDLGYEGPWTFAGYGKGQIIIPQAIPGDTYRLAVTTADEIGRYTLPDDSPSIDLLVAIKTTVPNTPDGLSISFGESSVVSWHAVTNADIAFYEVRLNSNFGGESDALLARTNSLSVSVPLTSRAGKIYLAACGTDGKYSLPATLEYNKALPPTPRAPTLTAKLGGFSLVEDAIPAGCTGMTVYIDGQETQSVHTVNNTLTYTCSAGIYDVTCAYTDLFGEGEKSPSSRITVKATVDSSLLEQGAVSMDKVEQALQETIRTGGGANDKIVQLVADLNDPEKYKKYTAFVQLNDAIELRVKSDEVVSKINLSPAGTTIDGRLLHVTGDTLIDNNLITKGMIQAKAISADKLDVQSLSAITATIGTLRTATSGARTEIRDNLILVYDSNNVLRVRMGVW